jgi:hypothetical protein
MLRIQFGWEGEGKFWALNNRIALSECCLLDISNQTISDELMENLCFSSTQFSFFIKWLVDDCELLYFFGQYLTNSRFQKQLFKEYKAKHLRLYNTNVKKWYQIIRRIFKRDNYICQYCGQVGDMLECDHIMPISKGGINDEKNLITACLKCNRQKKDKMVKEFKLWKIKNGW